MLKKTSSFVLAALRGSTYGKKYASPLRLLRPRWAAFLNILRKRSVMSLTFWCPISTAGNLSFSSLLILVRPFQL